MNHKTDMQAALQACVDAMLHDGVPTDTEHPKRIALDAAEAALASRPDAQPARSDLASRVLGVIHDVAELKPEEGETWGSWYAAAFELLGSKVGDLLAARDQHEKSDLYKEDYLAGKEAARGVPEGWTGNHEADSALIMLDRLDVSSDDDVRVDAISAIVRKLAAPSAHAAVAGELIYQVRAETWRHRWNDVPKFIFDQKAALEDWKVRIVCTIPQALASAPSPDREQVGEDSRRVDELSMLIRQLVHALRKAAPDNDLAGRAGDYLKRAGLQGSPLRVEAPDAPPSREQIGERWCFKCGHNAHEGSCADTSPCRECGERQSFPEHDPDKTNAEQGLYRKFEVRRVDGSDATGGKHDGCEYFVLDLTHDQHAPAALRAYAQSCASTHPKLSADLAARFGGERQGANAAYACDTCCDGDCLADNAGLPCPFSVSLRSVDECDPQSFINGVKWAREHAAGTPAQQECPHGVDDGACKRGVQGAALSDDVAMQLFTAAHAHSFFVFQRKANEILAASAPTLVETVTPSSEELMRLLTEYEGALQSEDEDEIAPARNALLAFLRPIRERLEAASAPALGGSDVGHALIERLRKTMVRLGVFPGEGLEWFAANLESYLYSLDRAVNKMLDAVVLSQPQAAEPKGMTDERAEFLAYWCEEVPDYMREKWKENVDQCLQDGNATEKLSAAWDAWQARALLANGE